MKVAYFCDTFYPQINGVTNTLERLNAYTKANHIDAIFLVPRYPGKVQGDDNVHRFFSIPLPFYKECRVAIPPIFKAERILDAFKPDIIHAYSEFSISLAGIRYAKKKNIPVVSSYTSNFSYYLHYFNIEGLNPYLENYLNWFHNSCRLTFCPSDTTREYLHMKAIDRVEIMKRGVDSERFNPSHRSELFRKNVGAKEDSVIFTYVGRVSPEKDLDILAAAAKALKQKYGDRAVFVIVGDGPYLDKLKADLHGYAYFTGFLKGEALAQAYASSDVFTFPSTSETFGNVVLEAMCSGLPAIVPDSGGVREIVHDGMDGCIVPPRDENSLRRCMERFLLLPQLIANMGQSAIVSATSRSWENVFGGLFRHYERLIGKKTS